MEHTIIPTFNIPTFNRLDFWYAQLYSWIQKDPSSRKEVTSTILKKCTDKRTHLEDIVGGKFTKVETIEDREVYIKFPDLKFDLDVDDRKIDCIAKIRINPCIRLSLFNIDGREEKNLNINIISKSLRDLFREKNTLLSENATISKENEGIWLITDKDNKREYAVRKEKDENVEKLYIYDKSMPPFYSKIWVIISTISKFSVNDELFKKINEKTKKLCDSTAEVYLQSLGGAKKEVEGSLHNIKIKSMASSDKRLLNLMFDKDHLNQLLEELDESEYLNEVLNAILSNLCEIQIKDWRKHLDNPCVQTAEWKLVKSDETQGLYTARQEKNNTTISAIFYSQDQPKYESINNILHGWGVDLSVVL